jgi:hypothetical protein
MRQVRQGLIVLGEHVMEARQHKTGVVSRSRCSWLGIGSPPGMHLLTLDISFTVFQPCWDLIADNHIEGGLDHGVGYPALSGLAHGSLQ